ncbi:carboxymuconolactone decarboxylase family protein [Streptosporangium pseudovulgare]|uniref:Alkyl hydroperoxide reductase AhpD n=1 Tax=Streptosporangium pseudovulgare TaxID=35765 RepID=A0ABQ2QXV9_9ACTN|nr:carboxymuconolactone decarboxylase family protein [Streptosporangium pseudovulgare]GGP99446.1 alkyl hydroperoxide reductase AhpD [Streptosporangium pseudovulgare]
MLDDLFVLHTLESAPAEARPIMEGTARKFGHVPAAVALMAGAPHLLKGFLAANGAFEQTSLTPLQREVVVMTVATRNACHLCVAMHTAALAGLEAPAGLVESLRERTPLPDPGLEALRLFTLAVMDRRGAVSDEEMRAFLDAGHTPRNALEVVLGVGAYTISTFANRMTAAPVDPALQPFVWEGEPT